ncbi:MAG: repressor LexA [Spirobacillus cienkowskii]|jgi:repressor LexA|uniref:Repressor LexA n=1 Tax=Spirobacillus cienkowskii TaxID=495820 RepID=A0A369KSQ6_9BACT|nr:MAG: repressor LexA [Spirobacillus cienkowskii]
MLQLTQVQLKVLEYIFQHIKTSGTPPTIREIAGFFGWKAIATAQDVIAALRKKGMLHSPLPGKSRQFVPTKSATDFISQRNLASSQEPESLVGKTNLSKKESAPSSLEVPLLGSVAAGIPYEAIEQGNDFILFPNVSASMQNKKLFALKIDGYSMIEVGMLPGDIVLVEKNQCPNNNDIVIASIANSETTIKRFVKYGSKIYSENIIKLNSNIQTIPPPALLVAENPSFLPIAFGLQETDKTIGIVRSLFRPSVNNI